MNVRQYLSIIIVALMAVPAFSQTVVMLSFQGLIKDSGGVSITTEVNQEFRMFDEETAGNLIDMDGDGVLEDVIRQDARQVLGVSTADGIIVPDASGVRQ